MGAKGHIYMYITKQVNECKALRGWKKKEMKSNVSILIFLRRILVFRNLGPKRYIFVWKMKRKNIEKRRNDLIRNEWKSPDHNICAGFSLSKTHTSGTLSKAGSSQHLEWVQINTQNGFSKVGFSRSLKMLWLFQWCKLCEYNTWTYLC